MREDFSEFELPQSLTRLFPPNGDGLFALLCTRMTDQMLRYIASLDYNMQVREHYAELKKMVDFRQVGRPPSWTPGEVLHLGSSANYGCADKKKLVKHDFYTATAFCCAALLQLEDRYEESDCEASTPISELAICLQHLDWELCQAAASFATHAIVKLKPWDEAYSRYAALLVGCAARAPAQDATQAELKETEDWAIRCTQSIRVWSRKESCLGIRLLEKLLSSERAVLEFAAAGPRTSTAFRQFCRSA